MYDITAAQYEILYKKYIMRPVDHLLLAKGSIKGKKIIDICAGTMRLSARAIQLGCDQVWAIEPSEHMIPAKYKRHIGNCESKLFITKSNLDYIPYDVKYDIKYDIAFCQQAINYWFKDKILKCISKVLKPDGKFIFDTFNTKPSAKPTTKLYEIDGIKYREISQLYGSTLYHLQMCDKTAPHFTKFNWIPPKRFNKELHKVFRDVECRVDGHTSVYICEGLMNIVEGK